MGVREQLAAARKAVSEGADWIAEPVLGWNFTLEPPAGPKVFGLEVRTRLPGKRWVKRFTVWAKDGQTAQVVHDGLDQLMAGEVEIDA